MQKLKAIIIDDKPFWLAIICKVVRHHFGEKLEIEDYSDFEEAKNRIMKSSKSFDLLITDILNDANDAEGLIFTKYVDEMKHLPVIVITAVEGIVKSTYKGYNVIEVFYKPNFAKEEMQFVLAVNDAIKKTLKRKENNHFNDDKSTSGNEENSPPSYLL